MERSLKSVAVLIFMAAMASAAWAQAQNGVPTCASKLLPCKDYLNGTTKPPSTCCDPMREAVKNELPCLCSLFKQTDLFNALNINLTQALQLPGHCGLTDGISACNATARTAPAPTAGAPPGTPGAPSKADRLAWTGASALALLWAAMALSA